MRIIGWVYPEGDEVCEDCADDPNGQGAEPLYSFTEYDYQPTCCECGEEIDVSLTTEAYARKTIMAALAECGVAEAYQGDKTVVISSQGPSRVEVAYTEGDYSPYERVVSSSVDKLLRERRELVDLEWHSAE